MLSSKAIALAATMLLTAVTTSFAQDKAASFPDHAITFNVPYAAGGNGDIVSRILAEGLQKTLGQPVIVDNRPGAGGNIGAVEAAKADPDGYTIVLGTNTAAVNMSLYPDAGFDLAKDFDPVSIITSSGMILLVNPDVPAKSVAEFVALAKEKPGELNYSSGGNGSSNHIYMELFEQQTGTDLQHIPYQGAAAAMTDLIAGRVDAAFGSIASVNEMIKSGTLRALAITAPERVAVLPDLQTFTEAGVNGMEDGTWQGVLVPKGTPPEIIEKLNAAIKQVLEDETIKAKFAAQGVTPTYSTSQEFGKLINDEVERWRNLIKSSGIVLQ